MNMPYTIIYILFSATIALLLSSENFIEKLIPAINKLLRYKENKVKSYCCIKIENKCYNALKLQGEECVLGLLRSGILEHILRDSDVKGIIITYDKMELHKVLRSLEAKILTYRVELERNPDNLRAKRKLELLEYAYKDLMRLNDPVRPSIFILVNDESVGKLKKKLQLYNCKLRNICSFFLGKGAPFVSNKILMDKVIDVLRYNYSLLSIQSSQGLVIGYELANRTPIKLPVWDRKLGSLHTLIIGPSGRGKTTLLARIVFESMLKEGYCVKVLDPKGDLEKLVKGLLVSSSLSLYGRRSIETLSITDLLEWNRVCRHKLVVSDESWSILSSIGASYMNLIRLARSRGISLVMSSQEPSDFSPMFWNNVHNYVIFGSSSPKYIEDVIRLAGIEENAASNLSRLGVGEALIKHFNSTVSVFFHVYPPPITVKNPREEVGEAGRRVLDYGQALDYPA